MIRILIADDHAVFREGVRALLQASGDLEVVGEAADGRQAIAECQRLRPDVILLDIGMPGLGGLEAALEIRRLRPETKILVLTQYDDREYIHRFLKVGVAGYVLKKSAGAELVAAIRAAARGGLALDPDVAREALRPGAGPAPGEGSGGARGASAADPYEALTDREKQVLKLVAEGHTTKEVATLLGISVKTAMTHREHLMQKLDLHTRTELIRFALQRAIIK